MTSHQTRMLIGGLFISFSLLVHVSSRDPSQWQFVKSVHVWMERNVKISHLSIIVNAHSNHRNYYSNQMSPPHFLSAFQMRILSFAQTKEIDPLLNLAFLENKLLECLTGLTQSPMWTDNVWREIFRWTRMQFLPFLFSWQFLLSARQIFLIFRHIRK